MSFLLEHRSRNRSAYTLAVVHDMFSSMERTSGVPVAQLIARTVPVYAALSKAPLLGQKSPGGGKGIRTCVRVTPSS
jgi:hypothetical protein